MQKLAVVPHDAGVCSQFTVFDKCLQLVKNIEEAANHFTARRYAQERSLQLSSDVCQSVPQSVCYVSELYPHR